LFVLLSTNSVKANNTALTTGAWEIAANWSLGTVPSALDNVIIPGGITITVKVSGDLCSKLSVASTGTLVVNTNATLNIGGDLINAGSFTATAGSTIIFSGTFNSVVSGGGTYIIAGTIVLNMSSASSTLDVQDPNFISGINSGAKYYFSFLKGTWKMDNSATLNDSYNTGSSNALTVPYDVTIESDAGMMNLGRNALTGNMILSGQLFLNGGTVNVQTGQGFNSGQDFQYHVNGGSPKLHVSAGTLNIGAGFNASVPTDYIDFNMSGGTVILALNGYSDWITFQLADVVGGKTVMSGGTIILQDACNANIEDLDMGGANVAATQYSVTGGTVQLGYTNTQNSSAYFGINAEPATNYPNIDFEAGVVKNAQAFKTGNINMLSLHVNTNMTFDATGFPVVNIISNNGTFAFDDEGGFIQSNNTVTFSGSVPQLISSTSLTNEIFYNLTISNSSGKVILGVPVTITNQLSFISGLLDASNNSITLSAGNIPVIGASSSNYVITGNGVTTTGQVFINNLSTNTSTLFPIGTATYYLPATVNTGANAGNSYSAFVFQGLTTNALENGPSFSAGVLSKSLAAEWNLTQTTGSGNASLTLNWASSGTTFEGSAFQSYGLNIGISQYSAGGWQMATGNGSVATQTATSTFNSFSQFSVVGSGVILPILLSDFNANLKTDNSVNLTWEYGDGADIRDFVVQKSNNGNSWNTIGTVESNSDISDATHYSLLDPDPATGANYYRLIVQNNNGDNSISMIREVNLVSKAKVSFSPNPARNTIYISASANDNSLYIKFMAVSGVLLQSRMIEKGTANSSIDVSVYPSGIYFLEVLDSDKILTSGTILITR
jgi:Secretion system C-terminal sorting domain/F5/8 type C domain